MFTTSLSLLERLHDPRDEQAWRQVVTLYTPLLRSWLRPHCPQEADAEDLTQDVLAVLAQKVGEFDHNCRMGAFRTWLRTIAANKLSDHLRSARRRGTMSGEPAGLLEQLEDPASDLSQRWERQHDRYVVRTLLARIRPDFTAVTWEAFQRVVVRGEATAAVAAALGLSTNAVLIAKSRVLARLRAELDTWEEK